MSQRLAWNEIQKHYDQQWVELIDYDWPDGRPHPEAGVVRAHAAERKEFYRMCKELDISEGYSPTDGAIVFVGSRYVENNPFLSSSLVRMCPCR